jgi:hypothetical protein
VALRHRLSASNKEDVVSWEAWPEPAVARPVEVDAGPVLIERRYAVAAPAQREFLELARGLESIRRRDGAMEWTLYEDVAAPGMFFETFLVASWGEHLRQHHRAVAADRKLLERLAELARAEGVTHLVDAFSAASARAEGMEIREEAPAHEPPA